MQSPGMQRARSAEAKHRRGRAILDAARSLATRDTVREVTLTDIAVVVGLHKSAMLRYFETREQIFLTLTAQEWQGWSTAVRQRLAALADAGSNTVAVAAAVADSLVTRPLFCDLLAQTPLNLERNVSIDAAYAFKTIALREADRVATALHDATGLTEPDAADVVSTATGMAGALWQMAAPGSALRILYETRPELAHAVVDVGPRLTRVLTMLLDGAHRHDAPYRAGAVNPTAEAPR